MGARQPTGLGRRTHHHPHQDLRKSRMRGSEVEIGVHESKNALPRRGRARSRRFKSWPNLADQILEDRAVQALLVAEVVVKHGLVGMGGYGDLIGAGAGQAVSGEMTLGSVQDSPCRVWVLGSLSSALHLRPVLRTRFVEYINGWQQIRCRKNQVKTNPLGRIWVCPEFQSPVRALTPTLYKTGGTTGHPRSPEP